MIQLPTASQTPALNLCNGRWIAEQGEPDPPVENAICITGRDIHAVLAGDMDAEKLSLADRELVERFDEQREGLMDAAFGGRTTNFVTEERFYMDPFADRGGELGSAVFSGQIDYIASCGAAPKQPPTRALIVDYKTGYKEVIASESLQLRAYAVLYAHVMGCNNILAAIIQRNRRLPDVVEFDANDLESARQELLALLEKAIDPQSKRTPHPDACQYCKAKAWCPEAAEVTNEIATVEPREITVASLPGLLEACQIAEGHIETIRSKARDLLIQDPNAVEGWGLKKGRTTRSVTDHAELRQRVIDGGLLTPEQMGYGQFKLPQLERLICEASGCTTSMARDRLNDAASDVIEAKTNNPMLKRL